VGKIENVLGFGHGHSVVSIGAGYMVLELVQTLQQQLVVDMVLEELLELGDMVPEEVLEPGVMVLEEVLEPGVMVLEEVLELGVMVLEEVLELVT